MNPDPFDIEEAKKILEFLQGYNLFGEMLVLQREEVGVSASQLAKKIDVTPAAISQWDVGKRLPDSGMVYRIEKVLNLSQNDDGDHSLKTAWDITHYFHGYIPYLEEAISANDLKTCQDILARTAASLEQDLEGVNEETQ